MANITIRDLRALVESKAMLEQLRLALPSNLSPQRIVRQFLTLVQNNPDLLNCTQASILSGLMQSAELGLEMTGPLGHCFLVPRRKGDTKVAVFQIGWKGYINLVLRTGMVKSISVRTVYKNDQFHYSLGTSPFINHEPAKSNRGEAIAYYAIAFFKEGDYDFEVMTKEEILEHKNKFVKTNSPYDAWVVAFNSMACKTVCRKLCARLPMCPQASQAAALDDEELSSSRFSADQNMDNLPEAFDLDEHFSEEQPLPNN